MALSLESLCDESLFAYHLTERVNVSRIQRTGILESTERLYLAAGADVQELRQPRRGPKTLVIGGETVHLRDQDPLDLERLDVSPWTDPGEWCAHVNRHVFFWPGTRDRPIAPGCSHFNRYRASDVSVFVIPMAELVRLNAHRLKVCSVNSGQTGARKTRVPRGPDTYVAPGLFGGSRSDVIEVVFLDHAELPASRKLVSCERILERCPRRPA